MNYLILESSKNALGSPNSGGYFKHGKFSIGAKIPKGDKGTLPAYWLSGWAGEADIFEFFHKKTNRFQTSVIDWKDGGARILSVVYNSDCVDFSEDFYLFTFEWTPYKLSFFVDGINYLGIL